MSSSKDGMKISPTKKTTTTYSRSRIKKDDDDDDELVDEFRKEIENILYLNLSRTRRITSNNALSSSSRKRNQKTDTTPENTTLMQSTANQNQNKRIIEESWNKFTTKHRISPFSINNNVTSSKLLQKITSKRNGQLILNGTHSSSFLKNQKEQSQKEIKAQHFVLWYLFPVIIVWILKWMFKVLQIFGLVISTLFIFYCIFILHKPTQRFSRLNISSYESVETDINPCG
jgi:hypothetical protein